MLATSLFPHGFRLPGWFLLVPGIALGFAYIFFEFEWNILDLRVWAIGGEVSFFSGSQEQGFIEIIENNLTDELASILTLIGAVFVAFSEESTEDEFHKRLRFQAMVWALKLQAIVLLLGVVFLYDMVFLRFMMIALFSFFLFSLEGIIFYYSKSGGKAIEKQT